MDHFAGLDVSVKETSICIVDDARKIVREVKVASEPEALLAVLKNPAYAQMMRAGLYRPVHVKTIRLFHLVFEYHDGRALVPSPKRSESRRATLTPEWCMA